MKFTVLTTATSLCIFALGAHAQANIPADIGATDTDLTPTATDATLLTDTVAAIDTATSAFVGDDSTLAASPTESSIASGPANPPSTFLATATSSTRSTRSLSSGVVGASTISTGIPGSIPASIPLGAPGAGLPISMSTGTIPRPSFIPTGGSVSTAPPTYSTPFNAAPKMAAGKSVTFAAFVGGVFAVVF